jgi:hypothetical protein
MAVKKQLETGFMTLAKRKKNHFTPYLLFKNNKKNFKIK